jgi:DNA repair photolyase
VQRKVLWVSPFVMNLNRIDPWYWCRYFIDVYSACPYGCTYCHTQRRGNLKGLDFIRGLPPGRNTIGLGLISDLYHPDPANNRITAKILDIIFNGGHSISVQTKSTGIVDDLDLLKRFAIRNGVQVTFTILTLNEEISSRIEGCAPSPMDRLKALETLAGAGIPTGVSITPIIPFLTDAEEELSRLVGEVKKRGGSWVVFSGFNPLHSFFQQPPAEALRSMYENEVLLNGRYRRIKHCMVRLLDEAELPMRVPRLNADPSDQGYVTRMVSEYLFNISHLYELLEAPLDSKRYLRAAYRVDEFEGSLKSVVFRNKLGYIKGINPEIERVIHETVMNGSPSLYETLQKTLKNRSNHG